MDYHLKTQKKWRFSWNASGNFHQLISLTHPIEKLYEDFSGDDGVESTVMTMAEVSDDESVKTVIAPASHDVQHL